MQGETAQARALGMIGDKLIFKPSFDLAVKAWSGVLCCETCVTKNIILDGLQLCLSVPALMCN